MLFRSLEYLSSALPQMIYRAYGLLSLQKSYYSTTTCSVINNTYIVSAFCFVFSTFSVKSVSISIFCIFYIFCIICNFCISYPRVYKSSLTISAYGYYQRNFRCIFRCPALHEDITAQAFCDLPGDIQTDTLAFLVLCIRTTPEAFKYICTFFFR